SILSSVDTLRMLLLSVLFFILGTASALCPPDYQQINGGDCFKLYTTQKTYDNAETQCVQDGGHLASVHSANEQNALTAIMGATTPLIGMRCTDGTASHCTWSDGSAVDYSNFPGTGPVINYGGCVHLSNTDPFWYSWNCAAPITGFLCRVSLNTQVTTCSGGYVAYNGGCAAVKKATMIKSDAEFSCAQEGGHLASIHSETDNSFYSKLAFDQGIINNIYIGLAWNAAGNAYKWTDDSTYNYNKFANQFPNTIFGECVQMLLSTDFGQFGQWTNIPCNTPMTYFCFRDSDDTTPKAPAQCPPIDFFYDNGTIYSPNFPYSIPGGQSCAYVLATEIGTKVAVNFPSFSTDTGSSLALYDGLDEVTPKTKLSVSVNPLQWFESETNIMKMVFTASANPTGQGWEADFVASGGESSDLPHSSTSSPFNPNLCPQQQYTPDPYIYMYSPNWPNRYPANADCLYYIQSRNSQRLAVEFEFVDTEKGKDVITIYDGPNNKSPILGTVSGQSGAEVKQFSSSGTTLTLEFVSLSTNQGPGWIAAAYNI
ncbi:hypothetical protein PMAYCL1PPCAC_28915, partial [Pristionchus mayeri]